MNPPRRLLLMGDGGVVAFDEADYLAANRDVAQAVASGQVASGRQHFELFGYKEDRQGSHVVGMDALADMRRAKLRRLRPLLDLSMPHVIRNGKYDFLSAALRAEARIVDTDNIASSTYSPTLEAMIADHAEGLVLDCGAGSRTICFDNVVNLEVVDYPSTDVIGIAERLPFRDGSFDAVISMAVLEHVRDPFAAAAEIIRVLKPGGELACGVPFLQPLHGYPHHYYNMTGPGLRALFERDLVIESHVVEEAAHPIWSLAWILRSWADGLPPDARADFLSQRVEDLMAPPGRQLRKPFVAGLSVEAQWELASGTFLRARKPGGSGQA